MSSNVEEYVPASAMVVVAHPDDAEFMAAGTVARTTGQRCGGAQVSQSTT